jgi:ubiquinone/menaquinone biosynthesis C-methylase UbiE
VNCDPIARLYRWLEYAAFGRALERRRRAYLPHFANAQRILVLGDGDGRALKALLRAAPLAAIDAIDVSPKMLALARSRAGDKRVTYFLADARSVALPEAEYDAIVTHFFLDCFTEAETVELVSKICVAAKPEALWVISEFQPDSLWSQAVVRGLYLFFAAATGLHVNRISDYRSYLTTNGFERVNLQTAAAGLLVSELWQYVRYQRQAPAAGVLQASLATWVTR